MAATISSLEKIADFRFLAQSDLIEAITEGLPAVLVRELAARLGVTMEMMAGLLRLTSRTLQRRLEDGALELNESERLWELARLYFRALEVLGNEGAAVQWLNSPIQALGWATPLSYAHTAVGLRELENILGRIEHGVFS